VIVHHVVIAAAPDYLTRREAHRRPHLERITKLRGAGFCVGGGPAADGRTAEIFYRTAPPGDLARLVEEDPYFTGGVWTGYTAKSFSCGIGSPGRPASECGILCRGDGAHARGARAAGGW